MTAPFRLALAFVLSVTTATASPDPPDPARADAGPCFSQTETERGTGWRRYGRLYIFTIVLSAPDEADLAAIAGFQQP